MTPTQRIFVSLMNSLERDPVMSGEIPDGTATFEQLQHVGETLAIIRDFIESEEDIPLELFKTSSQDVLKCMVAVFIEAIVTDINKDFVAKQLRGDDI